MSNSDFIYEAAMVAATTRKQAGGTPSALHEEIFHFPLANAVLCADCDNVSNGVRQCPACGSSALMSVSRTMGGAAGTLKDDGVVSPAEEVSHNKSEDEGVWERGAPTYID